MDRNAFAILCELLKTRGGLLDDGNMTIEEQVAIFVNILAHHTKNRCLQVRFYRSGETISRYVHQVLSALLRLQDMLLIKPTPIADDYTDRIWKWFKAWLPIVEFYEMLLPGKMDQRSPSVIIIWLMRGVSKVMDFWPHIEALDIIYENGNTLARNKEKYFNMKHSQARNIIERCFGILKKRWRILRSPSLGDITKSIFLSNKTSRMNDHSMCLAT